MNRLPDALDVLFADGAVRESVPVLDLPQGRLVVSEEGRGAPVMWMSDGPVVATDWARLFAEHDRSGLWPLMLLSLSRSDDFRPWGSGELFPRRGPGPDLTDPEQLLAKWWASYTEADEGDDSDDEANRRSTTAPYGERWPGLAPARVDGAVPDAPVACTAEIVSAHPSARLGLVVAGSGAQALAVAGWSGPLNYENDTRKISAVLSSWESRFGAVVVGAGFAELYLSVAMPPQTLGEALQVAAEHFALCPDNIWQGAGTLAAYAEGLVGSITWEFWWD